MSRTDPSKSELVKLREHLLKKKKYHQRWGAEGGEEDGGGLEQWQVCLYI